MHGYDIDQACVRLCKLHAEECMTWVKCHLVAQVADYKEKTFMECVVQDAVGSINAFWELEGSSYPVEQRAFFEDRLKHLGILMQRQGMAIAAKKHAASERKEKKRAEDIDKKTARCESASAHALVALTKLAQSSGNVNKGDHLFAVPHEAGTRCGATVPRWLENEGQRQESCSKEWRFEEWQQDTSQCQGEIPW